MNRVNIIVAGGRDFRDYEYLSKTLTNYISKNHFDAEVGIVSGMARGADAAGHAYAMNNGLAVAQFPAKWDLYGKSAGYKRNEEMAHFANELIAFYDGVSRGTGHMIKIMENMKKPVLVVDY